MRLSDVLTQLAHNPMGGYNAGAAAAFAGMTLDQLNLIRRDPQSIKSDEEEATTERDYHRLYAIANGWPEWLEAKDWRERHPA